MRRTASRSSSSASTPCSRMALPRRAIGVALRVGMIEVEHAALADHRIVVEVLLQPLPQLHRPFVERLVAGQQIVRADDGGVAARIAGADVALLQHRDVGDAVLLREIIGGREPVPAAADDDDVVLGFRLGLAPGRRPARVPAKTLLSAAKKRNTSLQSGVLSLCKRSRPRYADATIVWQVTHECKTLNNPRSLAELEARFAPRPRAADVAAREGLAGAARAPGLRAGARRRDRRRRDGGAGRRLRAQMPCGAIAESVRPRAERLRGAVGNTTPAWRRCARRRSLTGPAFGFSSLTFRAWFEAQFGAAAWRRLSIASRACNGWTICAGTGA